MNLVLSLLIIGGSSVAVWGGITNPEDGIFAGIGRALRGEPQPEKTDSQAAFLGSLAGLMSLSGSGGKAAGRAHPGKGAGRADTGKYRLGPVKPWVRAAAYQIGPMFQITTILGFGTRDNATDHDDGLALDFMTGSRTLTGSQLAGYVKTNARRLGVQYIIYRQRIWNVDRASEGWRAMEDRGSATANHMDHVHVSFKAGGPR